MENKLSNVIASYSKEECTFIQAASSQAASPDLAASSSWGSQNCKIHVGFSLTGTPFPLILNALKNIISLIFLCLISLLGNPNNYFSKGCFIIK